MSDSSVIDTPREAPPGASPPPFSFITGTAGTGKTFMVRERAAANPRAVLCATTGIAAINLGGTTINALLKYYDTKSLKDSYVAGWLQATMRKLAGSAVLDYYVDEVSMMDGNQLDILVRAFDEVNVSLARQGDDGPLTLNLVGDFAQLPPVKAPFAFEVDAWKRFTHVTKLTDIRRQHDPAFVAALQAVRCGNVAEALAFFGPRLTPMLDDLFQGSSLKARNDEVDRYNSLRLAQMHTPEIVFTSKRWGRERGEWKLIPDPLVLREGALVMVLANKRIPGTNHFEYVNGDLGTLLTVKRSTLDGSYMGDTAVVDLVRTGHPVEIDYIRREYQIPTGALGKKKARFEVSGWIDYMPLRLAYATTTHKSQGLSLDRAQVDIRDHFFTRCPQMLYVALSRVRTANGLRLVGTPDQFVKACKIDPKIKEWI